MNLLAAEEAALDYARTKRLTDLQIEAFAWANRKQHDRNVSKAYRERAADVRRRLWDAAGQERSR